MRALTERADGKRSHTINPGTGEEAAGLEELKKEAEG